MRVWRKTAAVRRALVAVSVLTFHTRAFGQTASTVSQSPAPPPGSAFRQTWELSLTGGARDLPGSTLSENVSVQQPTAFFESPQASAGIARVVTSWFLQTTVVKTIQPLTIPAGAPQLSTSTRPLIGFRATRWLHPRLGIEIAADFAGGTGIQLGRASLGQIEASRASFGSAFMAIFLQSPTLYTNPSATAMTSTTMATGGQVQASAAFILTKASGRLRPYASVGFGERLIIGGDERVTVAGQYAFSSSAGALISQADQVVLRYLPAYSSVTYLLGGGIRWYTTARRGIRADAGFASANVGGEMTVSTASSSATGTPSGFVVQPSTPVNTTIVFSNTPSQQMSLSGAPLNGLITARGGGGSHWGWQSTISWFWRF